MLITDRFRDGGIGRKGAGSGCELHFGNRFFLVFFVSIFALLFLGPKNICFYSFYFLYHTCYFYEFPPSLIYILYTDLDGLLWFGTGNFMYW